MEAEVTWFKIFVLLQTFRAIDFFLILLQLHPTNVMLCLFLSILKDFLVSFQLLGYLEVCYLVFKYLDIFQASLFISSLISLLSENKLYDLKLYKLIEMCFMA